MERAEHLGEDCVSLVYHEPRCHKTEKWKPGILGDSDFRCNLIQPQL